MSLRVGLKQVCGQTDAGWFTQRAGCSEILASPPILQQLYILCPFSNSIPYLNIPSDCFLHHTLLPKTACLVRISSTSHTLSFLVQICRNSSHTLSFLVQICWNSSHTLSFLVHPLP